MKTAIEMAREAGLRDCTCDGTKGCLERFAELVRSDERKGCIEACWTLELNDWEGRAACIDAIRARSKK
jgi:hypothetical protein